MGNNRRTFSFCQPRPHGRGSSCILSVNVIFWLRRCQYTVGGWASPSREGTSCPLQREGVVFMVTYSDLFQFCLVVIGIIGLVFQITKKEVTAPAPQLSGYFNRNIRG